MLVAVASSIAYCLLVRKLVDRYDPLTIVRFQAFMGMLLFMPLFFIFDYEQVKDIPFTLYNLRNIILLGVFSSSLAFFFFTIFIRRKGINMANIFSYLVPVVTVIVAYFVLNEPITTLRLIAIFIVIVGLFNSQYYHLGKIVALRFIATANKK